jgi:hypothetical protein
MKAIERLEALLDTKDQEIEELQRKLETAEREIEYQAGWCRHVEFEAGKEPNPELPVPRLEIRWTEDQGETVAVYSMVYRHMCEQIVFVPLGRTTSSGALAEVVRGDGTIRTPFRDGSHFANEIRQLRMPGYIIAGDSVHRVILCSVCQRPDEFHGGSGLHTSCTLLPRES